MFSRALKNIRFWFAVKPYDVSKNYYHMLSLTQTATQQEIKKSFRQLAKKYHPDSNNGNQEKFKEVNQAYQVLSDTQSKNEYDQIRHSKSESPRKTYQASSTGHKQQQYYQQKTQYRGYQRQEGWRDMGFREKFMQDLYRQQQAQFRRHFHASDQESRQRQFREKMREATRRGPQETMKQYSQHLKNQANQARKRFQERERRRMQREQEEFKKYRDQSYQDSKEKMQEKMNKLAEGIADNVKGVMKVREMAAELWNAFKKRK